MVNTKQANRNKNMKASELLEMALKNYTNDSYMCHEIDHLKDALSACPAAEYLRNKIQRVLNPHATIVLHNLLCKTNKRYKSYDKRYGFYSNACYKMRVVFWQDMIAELKAEGL
jgi:hypothetical protein